MEHIHAECVRVRDNDSCAHPIQNPAAPLIQPDPSLPTPNGREFSDEYPASSSPPPPTANSQHANKPRFLRLKPRRPKPLFRGFETPSFSRIAILTVLCLITYPAFHLLTLMAKDKSLFVVRLIVSLWCSGIGFALGYILLKIGARQLEAATWATVIHMSHEGDGMKLRDLSRGSSNPTSFVPAFHILRYRFGNQEASRSSRKSYDKRPWTMFLGFFVILAILSPLLPFLFGRIMDIETFVGNRRRTYHEVLVTGDLSEEDLQWMTPAELQYRRGTPDIAEFVYNNDTVYFAQPSVSQFVLGGSAFNRPAPIGLKGPSNDTLVLMDRDAPKSDISAVIRYPQWGIRIHCEKLPDPEVNLVPGEDKMYTLVPRDFLRGLFGVYGMDLPTLFVDSDLSGLPNDTIPSNIDLSAISAYMTSSDLGANFYTTPFTTGNQGWTTVEIVTIVLNTSFAPSGRFPVYWNESLPDANGTETRMGFDAAACVQKYESWIIEVYNTSTGSSYALQIVEKVDSSTSPSPSGNIRGSRIAYTRYLNTTGKDTAFRSAHDSSAYRVKTIGHWDDHNNLMVSFTDGTGLLGYTELSPNRFADFRARVGAAHALPYLVGSGLVVAQSYENETLAYVTYKRWPLIALPVLLWILGIIGELFVPTLPLNIPRREFGVYSWLALFQSQELQFDAAGDLDKFMSLDELEENLSDRRVKFVT